MHAASWRTLAAQMQHETERLVQAVPLPLPLRLTCMLALRMYRESCMCAHMPKGLAKLQPMLKACQASGRKNTYTSVICNFSILNLLYSQSVFRPEWRCFALSGAEADARGVCAM